MQYRKLLWYCCLRSHYSLLPLSFPCLFLSLVPPYVSTNVSDVVYRLPGSQVVFVFTISNAFPIVEKSDISWAVQYADNSVSSGCVASRYSLVTSNLFLFALGA